MSYMISLDIVHSSWKTFIKSNLYLIEELTTDILLNCRYYPDNSNIFKVFEIPLNKIEVVILGVEPYYLHGLSIGKAYALSKEKEMTLPLRKIREEIIYSVPFTVTSEENWKTLDHLTKQGVFLLNTALTVESGSPTSHLKYWKEFIEKVIIHISVNNPCIWLIWGNIPQGFISQIKGKTMHVIGYDKDSILNIPKDDKMNYILKTDYPDSKDFIGCNHFYYTNKILEGNRKFPIQW